jgi:predicted nuclease of restriction endonuclease-like (RecB) superfamily
MRNFYLAYKDTKKLAQTAREIGWTHNFVIIERCKNNQEREYYINMARNFGWTRNVLEHNIDIKSYEQFLTNQTSFDRTLKDKYKHQAKLAVRDEYSFAFLELGEEHSEREIERGLMDNIRKFLIEMGEYFSFIGS